MNTREIKFKRVYQHSEMGLITMIIWGNVDFKGNPCFNFGFFKSPSDISGYHPIADLQFTGLKDKNGKEIYEGDILKHWYSDSLFNWLISFDDGSFVLQNIGVDGYLMDKYKLTESGCLDREVIGNMYENPELLK